MYRFGLSHLYGFAYAQWGFMHLCFLSICFFMYIEVFLEKTIDPVVMVLETTYVSLF